MTECCEIDLTLGPTEPIVLSLGATTPIELTLGATTPIELTIGNVTPIDLTLTTSPIELTLATEGQQGPPGPQGPPGVDFSYDHTQSSPAAEWIVNHNAGFKPDVEVRNTAGGVVGAEVLHINVNQTRIYFSAPQSGSAHFG